MNQLPTTAVLVAITLGLVGQANAWQLGYKEGGVCVTMQEATAGKGAVEIAFLPQSVYLIKFASAGSIGDKFVGSVSVMEGSTWSDFSVDLQVVQDAVLGVASYSYHGMPDQLRNAIRSGSTLKFDGNEFALAGSSAALKEIVTCVEGRR